MITRKLNPRVYDSLLVLLDAVHLYRVYRWLDTLPLYIYYELLIVLVMYAIHCLLDTVSHIYVETPTLVPYLSTGQDNKWDYHDRRISIMTQQYPLNI